MCLAKFVTLLRAASFQCASCLCMQHHKFYSPQACALEYFLSVPGSTVVEWSCWCWICPFSGVINLEVYHFIMSLPTEIEIAHYKLEIRMAIFPRKHWFIHDRTCICLFHKSFQCRAWFCKEKSIHKTLFSQCILMYNILKEDHEVSLCGFIVSLSGWICMMSASSE